MFQIIGNIRPPEPVARFMPLEQGGGGQFLQLILRLLLILGGLYALFNLILAGYAFISAGDDSKKIAGAWARIWQTLLGMVIMAGSFVLAALFGMLVYGDWNAILNPLIPTI